MEASYAEEKAPHQQPSIPRKGGFRTLPFIIVNESFEKIGSYGLMANMIFYLMKEYHLKTANGATILFLWSAISNAMAIGGALLSDSYLGRFRVIAFGSLSTLLGMILLWITTMIPQLRPPPCITSSDSSCASATTADLTVLLVSFGLMAVGSGCVRPCSMAFGADQLDSKDNPNNEGLIQSFFNWYYASVGTSTIIALSVIVYIQDHLGWKVGFGIPALLMAISTLMFFLGSSLYVKMKADKSLFVGLIRVLVAAFKNKDLNLPAQDSELYHRGLHSKLKAPTEKLRFLNKACIVRDPEKDLDHDGSASKPWSLCTVDQVEALKTLIRVLPIWSSGITILISLNQFATFGALQASIMDRHLGPSFQIPAGSFTVFTVLTLTIWVTFYDRAVVPALAKCAGRPRGLSAKVRMGIGSLLAALAMGLAAVQEGIRRRRARESGFTEKPGAILDMSAMWLAPQFCLFGLAEATNAIGQIDFYYSQFPKSMGSIAVALFTVGMAVANGLGSLLLNIVDGVTEKGGDDESWVSNNLNKGHLDYYYWLLAAMSMANFGYFLICSWAYGASGDEGTRVIDERLGKKEDDDE